MLSYPDIQKIMVTVHAPSGDDGRSNLGKPEEWVPVLSHLMESCPNLKNLTVLVEPHIKVESLAESFPSRVFPHLPQGSKAVEVVVVFGLRMERGRYEVGFLSPIFQMSKA